MEFQLYFFSKYEYLETINTIAEIVEKVMGQNVQPCKFKFGTDMGAKGFCITIFDEMDYEDIIEDYELNVNFAVNFDVISRTSEEALPKVFKIIRGLLDTFDGDLLFTGDHSIQLIKKDDTGLVVSDNDEYFFKFPFEEIGLPFTYK